MLESSVKLLAMTGEAAVLVSKGRAIYANAEARAVLGEDCAGKRVSELFGELISGVQSPSFLAQVRLGSRAYLLRIARLDGDQIFFLRPQDALPALLNEPFLYALRSSLMNLELAAGQLRAEAEALGSEKLLEGLQAVTRSKFQLQRLMNNASLILSFSEGQAVCIPRVFSLSELCASVMEAAGQMIPEIRFSFRGTEGVMVFADPRLIKDLLLNLLSNAVRHGQGCQRISLSVLESERSVVLAVDDDGCGIPPEELPRVFDRYRHSFDLRQMGAGPGLGLTAARLIAQLHGGALLLESRPGQGTTLRVSLQRENAELMHAHAPGDSVVCDARDLLTGLADCLPPSCFREQYLD